MSSVNMLISIQHVKISCTLVWGKVNTALVTVLLSQFNHILEIFHHVLVLTEILAFS